MLPVKPIHLEEHSNDKQWKDSITKILTGNIDFRTNIQCAPIFSAFATPAALNTEFIVTHNLGYVPIGFFLIYSSGACAVYDSGTVWTKTQVFLKCNAFVNIRLIIF